MTVFAKKLDRIPETIRMAADASCAALIAAIADPAAGLAVAAGSGGFAVCAECLAQCRATARHGPTRS